MLLIENVIILAEYLNFMDVFSKNLAKILPKQIRANEYAIELEKGKQPLYKPIYTLEAVELKTFKSLY